MCLVASCESFESPTPNDFHFTQPHLIHPNPPGGGNEVTKVLLPLRVGWVAVCRVISWSEPLCASRTARGKADDFSPNGHEFPLALPGLRPEFGGSLNQDAQLCVQVRHSSVASGKQERHRICVSTKG